MKRSEIAALLTYLSEMDNRKWDEDTVSAWFETIGDLDFRDTLNAARAHYRHEDGYLTTRHLVRGVYRERSRRLEGFIDPLPLADPDDTDAYKRELLANRKATGDGKTVPSGEPELTGPPSPEVARKLATMRQLEDE